MLKGRQLSRLERLSTTTGRSLTPTNAWKSNRVKEISRCCGRGQSEESIFADDQAKKPVSNESQPGFEIQDRCH